ncbi:Metalloprotease TIKI-like [Stylophora pistillata]|uniref:Metalloprotease TIKI homolog n=1 Tax=Stylophora pistillata TaxID=50429 RepID=A0A2B4S601_STYPI|nr:Metalloprotease TIKI-like [Stylophora pistillata]
MDQVKTLGPHHLPIITCLVCTPLYLQLQENLNSFLWLVKRNPPAYFFGTIHVPYTRVWEFIPSNSKAAFKTSQYVYFELDLTSKPTVNALWKCQMLPKGGLLKDVLPRSMYRRLQRHLRYIKKRIPMWLKENDGEYYQGMAPYADKIFQLLTKDWQKKRPIWIMLMVNSLTESDIKNRGIPVLDQYLASEAARNEKFTGAVEEVEEQCQPLNSLKDTQVVFALNQTLNFQEKLRVGKAHLAYTTDDLIDHYNCGDLTSFLFSTQSTRLPSISSNFSLRQLELKRTQEIDQYLRTELIFKRNERMAKRVIELLNNYKALRVTNPGTRKKKRRRKCRKRHRRRCSRRRRKRPDFSRVKLVLKVTKTPAEKRENITESVGEDLSNDVSPIMTSVAAPVTVCSTGLLLLNALTLYV